MSQYDPRCGALFSPQVIEDTCLAFASAGEEPLFSDAAPAFNGFGEGKCVLLQDAEQRLFGKTLPAFTQTRGICVGDGTTRACQDSLYWSLAFGNRIGKPVALSVETIYGGARVVVGRGQMGIASPWGSGRSQNDGAFPGQAAQYVRFYGLLARGKYGSIDLSKFREDLAIQYGNAGVPKVLLQESQAYRAAACMLCRSVENVRDSIAGGYACSTSGNFALEGTRDKDGCLDCTSCGGHCMECCGVFIDIYGDLKFVIQQSWGDNVHGSGTWKLADGREVTPRMGSAAVPVERIEAYLKQGEVWSFAPPEAPWETDQQPSDFAGEN